MNEVFYAKKKSSKGGYYDVIYVKLGYRNVSLCFDRNLIAEILGISVGELYEIKPDTEIKLGQITTLSGKV